MDPEVPASLTVVPFCDFIPKGPPRISNIGPTIQTSMILSGLIQLGNQYTHSHTCKKIGIRLETSTSVSWEILTFHWSMTKGKLEWKMQKSVESERPLKVWTAAWEIPETLDLTLIYALTSSCPRSEKKLEKIEIEFGIWWTFPCWFYKTELTHKNLKYQIIFQMIFDFCNRIDE